MIGYAVMRTDGTKKPRLDVVWPTRVQAVQSAGFCSYPVEVVRVEVSISSEPQASK